MSDDLAVRFATLFAGRGDAYGAVEGRCVCVADCPACRAPKAERHTLDHVREKVTLDLFRDHLYGDGSVGIYPLLDNGTVRWGCVDVDEGYDLIAIAINLYKALRALGITSWVERTKGKGFHTWIFCSDWVPAADMVAAQRVACQVAGYNPKEVNPKQTTLAPGKLGNYVNLAYSKKWVAEGKRVVLNVDHRARYPYTLQQFVDKAEQSLNKPTVIAAAASLYTPPEPPKLVVIDRPSSAFPSLRGAARCLWEDGPLPSLTTGRIDRSSALQRLAHLCRAQGDITAGEAYNFVSDLDARLGKYVGRADAELQYQRIVERAYG